MGKRVYRRWGLFLCAMLTAVLIGCQSIGGFNFDDMILKQLQVTSQEQSGTLEINIDWKQEFFKEEGDEEFARLLPLLSKISLNIENYKYDAQGRMKLTGSLSLGGQRPVAFTVHTDLKKLRMDIDGAKRPLVLDLGGAAETLIPGMGWGLGGERQSLGEPVRKLVQSVASYFVRNLPNPPKLEVGRGASLVHGESVMLTKVHAELNGEEMGGLLLQYIDTLVKDEAGFKEMLRGLMKWAQDLPPELVENLFGEPLPPDFNSEESLQTGFDELFPELKQAQSDLADMKDTPEWKEIFDKGTALKTDLYVDDRLQLRKSAVELVIAPDFFKQELSPVRSITVRSTAEMWNVSGNPVISDVEMPASALTLEQLGEMRPVSVVRLFEPDSAMYDLLKNQLRIDDVSFELDSGWGPGSSPYLSVQGSAEKVQVPLRAALEPFDIRVTYTAKTKEVRFTDPGTWQEIVLHVGSSEALVNAEPVALSSPVQMHGSNVFMEADDLFTLLHATYTYSDTPDGELSVQVTRDL